jgi:hypothetical protein
MVQILQHSIQVKYIRDYIDVCVIPYCDILSSEIGVDVSVDIDVSEEYSSA